MRILVANKFWYRRGGLERVIADEVTWLQERGHEVAHFAAAHPRNDDSPWSAYFVPYLELGESAGLALADRATAAARMFSNGEARRRFDRLLADFRPDVVHAHGIHRQVSPSILSAARQRGVPVVQSLHDYHHVCPADVLLYRQTTPCEPRRCGTLWYGPAVGGRCLRGSVSASALSAAETSWQRLVRSYERGVARFVCPSRFMADRMAQGGWTIPCDVVPNAVPVPPRTSQAPGEGFAVIGRLASEKGVGIALEAAARVGARVTVAGEGPLGSELRASFPGAEFVGVLDGDGVAALIRRSRAVVVPSTWFENASMTVLESMAEGVPVIASRIGGIPEQVTDGVDGLLAPPGDVAAFADAIGRLAEDEGLAGRLGEAAREAVASRFSPERHVEGILASYAAAGARP